MVNLDWRVETSEGVTLAELLVRNSASVARRVRIGNRLDGPVWPPRHEGVSEAGWDDGGFEGVVPAGERLALGYASPAPAAEPPAEVVWSERAASEGRAGERAQEARSPDDSHTKRVTSVSAATTPSGVVRALGDGRPPADAVPVSVSSEETASEPALPGPVESWFAAVERRAERAASLANGTPEVGRLETDRQQLLAVARRAEQLATRVASTPNTRGDDRRTQ
ncbi:DUF7857 domain-containing protein [Halorussus halophilus]|uniref:DUF7857 domain-containing protein n=1 Tax=Halorussus halophilus TaxID=2650975 RepID=UPI001300D8F9|nr:hypothetical protein [Halorussus halophilus]